MLNPGDGLGTIYSKTGKNKHFETKRKRPKTCIITEFSQCGAIPQKRTNHFGKDEVTSSNLVISSRKILCLCGFQTLRAA